MSAFITSIPQAKTNPKIFRADKIDQIVLLRQFARFLGVELSLSESKGLVDANAKNIITAHDFVAFVEAVINDRKVETA